MSDSTPDVPDYYLSPFFPGVHKEPAQPANTGLSQDELNSLRDKLITSILQVFSQAVLGAVDPTGTLSGALAQLSTWANGIPILGTIVQALTGVFGDLESLTTFGNNIKAFFDGIDLTDTSFDFATAAQTFVTNVVEPFITAVAADLKGLVNALFGVDIGSEDPVTAVERLGGNLQSFLANIDFNQSTSDFNPIQQLTTWLQSVGTPGGILNSTTPVPTHLLGALNTGQYVTVAGFANPVCNQQPDSDMLNANAIQGGGVWSYDATKTASAGVTGAGSYKVTAAGIVREGIFVPVPTAPGQITDLGIFTSWTGATSSTGQSLKLLAYAYDANDDLISDSMSTVCVIPNLPANSVGYTGTDPISGNALAANGAGWVQMVGEYLAPPLTVNVRLAFDVDSTVSVGAVNISKVLQSVRNGFVDSNMLTNVENFVGQWQLPNLQGFSDLLDGNATWQHLLDGLGSAYNAGVPVSGADFSGLFAVAQSSSTNAITAAFQAALHSVILGNRTNKSTGTGANATSVSSLEVGHYSSGGTLTSTALAAGQCLGMVYTVAEFATYGFVEILAQIPSSAANHVFLNIYKIDPSTNVKTALFNSADIISTIGTASLAVPNRVLLPGMPQVAASDRLLIEIANNSSSNALTIVSKNNVVNNNTAEVIQNIGWTRAISAGGASPTSLTSGQGSYQATNAFANIGITSVPADYHPPVPHQYTTAQTGTTLAVPSFMSAGDLIDYAAIAGGGGGGSSLFGLEGQGGGAAAWQGGTLVYGTDVKIGSSLTLTVGGRGTAGNPASGGRGDDTTITYTDPSNTTHTITSLGGAYGVRSGDTVDPRSTVGNDATGQAAGQVTVNNIQYFGGASVGPGATGQSPGGGGGGAFPYANGGAGSVGELDIVFRQA